MILVDTSVWIDHLRIADAAMDRLLFARDVLAHPFIVGELALGNFRDQAGALRRIKALPQLFIAPEDEVIDFIIRHAVFGTGIGHVDVHLLVSTHATPGTSLWTRDKRLSKVCVKLGIVTL